MAYEKELIAAMGNPEAARAWRQARLVAKIAKHNAERSDLWWEKWARERDERCELQKRLFDSSKAIRQVDGELLQTVTERDLAREESRHWANVATELSYDVERNGRRAAIAMLTAAIISVCYWGLILLQLH